VEPSKGHTALVCGWKPRTSHAEQPPVPLPCCWRLQAQCAVAQLAICHIVYPDNALADDQVASRHHATLGRESPEGLQAANPIPVGARLGASPLLPLL